jgi:hypothetical protein
VTGESATVDTIAAKTNFIPELKKMVEKGAYTSKEMFNVEHNIFLVVPVLN